MQHPDDQPIGNLTIDMLYLILAYPVDNIAKGGVNLNVFGQTLHLGHPEYIIAESFHFRGKNPMFQTNSLFEEKAVHIQPVHIII